MIRPEGWDVRLRELVEHWRPRRFEWGVYDCCTLAIDAYHAIMQAAPPGAPAWGTRAEAEYLLAQQPLEKWITASLGEPQQGWSWARRGDLLLVSSLFGRFAAGQPVIGVSVGAAVACIGMDGMVFPPIKSGSLTWRIGE